MGFLLGMAGKLAAGSRVRSLQARMMRVQSNLRRVSREYANMERLLNSQKNAELTSIRYMGAGFQQGLQLANQTVDLLTYFKNNGGSDFIKDGQLDQDKVKSNGALYNSIMQGYSSTNSANMNAMAQANQNIQMFMQMQQSQVEQQYEIMKELQLDPLKDTEDQLQLEKDSLESQIQLAQADYEACKEMEKDGAKNLRPQYTGDGRG